MIAQKAFTLIELSLVLVIIGLLIGGVLGGKELIKQAQLRKLHDEVIQIKTAVAVFQGKYNCLPGDCIKAETFFGSDASCPNTPPNVVPKTPTCNGNGNGLVDHANVNYEWLRLFQHLANANLIMGKYTGTPARSGSANWDTDEGISIPKTSYGGGLISYFAGPVADTVDNYPNDQGHAIMIGKKYLTFTNWAGLLLPIDLYSIDMKYDDGKPGTGYIVSSKPSNSGAPNCTIGTNKNTAIYNVGNTGNLCTYNTIRAY